MLPLSAGDPIRLGPYRLTGVLGEGGMGKVYFGTDAAGRAAAVKVLRPDLAHDRHLADRFLREAHTAQSVRSEGIAKVLGAQTEGGRPWIATEYLAGPTLDEGVEAHGPLDETGVRVLAASLATTLRDIHRAGLVHRDLKPSNVVLTSDGPRIIDFGIARPEHGLTLTTTGQAPVTPGYGAPEQILGHRVGPAADVFSLGAVLVQAASGRRAYDGPHVAAVQYQVVHGEPDLSAVPDALRPLIAPCLAGDPAARPALDAVVEAFAPPRGASRLWRRGAVAEQIRQHEQQARRFTSPSGTAVASGGRPSRRRLLAVLAAGGAVLATGGSAWWLSRGPGLPEAADAEPAERLSADDVAPGSAPAPLWGPLEAAAPGSSSLLPLRDVVIFAGRAGGLVAHRVTDGKEKWSLDGVSATAGILPLGTGRFAATDGDGTLVVHDASTSERRWSLAADAEMLLAASPDGSQVHLLTRSGEIAAIGTDGPGLRWSAAAPSQATVDSGSAAAAGDDTLVVCTSDGTYLALDTRTGKELWTLSGHASSALTPAVEGRTVYVGGEQLLALGLRDGKEIWSLSSESLDPAQNGWGSPVVHQDVLAAIDDGRLYRVPKAAGGERMVAWPDGTEPSRTPPVAEGATVWIAEGGTSSGVSAFGESLLWTYEPESEGPWHMAGAGNRVFLLNGDRVVAMPVL